MQEAFLHFLWQFQYFDKHNLTTAQGESVQVIKTGFPHTNSGPDFSQARIWIGGIEWAGSVEIHLHASDWNAHTHQHDGAYENVILHVVWKNDGLVFRKDGSSIPTLELANRTDIRLLQRYEALMVNRNAIPCASQFGEVNDLQKLSMLDRALTQRLQSKAQAIEELLKANQYDWEQTAYQALAKNFGFKLNSDAFLALSKAMPLKVLQKHRDNPTQIEAMLFGQAGLLPEEWEKGEKSEPDEYTVLLRREFAFLSHKYELATQQLEARQWKFLRLRPANFPTVRLAQFARLVTEQASLFSLLVQEESIKGITKALAVQQSDYWQQHYTFGKKTTAKVPALGKSAIDNILINTVVPLLVCYANQKANRLFLDRAVEWLEQLPAESNHITHSWQELGLKVKNAFDSQASIELYNYFCTQKQCLQCNVGNALVKNPR